MSGDSRQWTGIDELGVVRNRMRRLPTSLWGSSYRTDIDHPLFGANHSSVCVSRIAFIREDRAIIPFFQFFFGHRSECLIRIVDGAFGEAELGASGLSNRGELCRRLTVAANDNILAVLHALDQPRKMRLGLMDVDALGHAWIIG